MEKELAPLLKSLADEERPVIVAVNKIDMFHDKSKMLPLLIKLSELLPKAEIYPLSAMRRNGTKELADLIVKHLPEGEAQFPADQLSTAPMRFMASEIIRERLFDKLYQEVPYAVAVDIEQWEEDEERNQIIIHASIFVARPSHKAMVIGKAGAGIKDIGTESRKRIRELVGGDKKVHLELWVKVREDWLDDAQFLHELGFGAQGDA